jgi:hypothetical protein
VPDNTQLRRGIRGDKLKDGQISKSAFQDKNGVSCDMASQRTVEQTMANSDALVATVEFSAKDAKTAFPNSKVIFRCLPENPWHCQLEGKQTDGQAKAFAATMSGQLK